MEIKDQNELLTNENKLVNVKYNEIITENQSLINELSMMKTTLYIYYIAVKEFS